MIITVQCQDRTGLVASVSRVLSERNLNIISMREHVDVEANRFFTRIVTGLDNNIEEFSFELGKVLPQDAMVKIFPLAKKKIVLLVTREYHCLSDILVRNHFNTLGAEVCCVIGNHLTLEDICNRFGIPFYYISHENKTKEDFEREISNQLGAFDFDFIILAKFMRILSPAFVQQFPYKIINIHHSFLPAFVGANPYRKAYNRGVKMIGATAHFVTSDLDEGPIIEQQIIRVDHTYLADDMKRAGKEIEKSVLAKAMKMVFEDRVFIYNNKTVVFE